MARHRERLLPPIIRYSKNLREKRRKKKKEEGKREGGESRKQGSFRLCIIGVQGFGRWISGKREKGGEKKKKKKGEEKRGPSSIDLPPLCIGRPSRYGRKGKKRKKKKKERGRKERQISCSPRGVV